MKKIIIDPHNCSREELAELKEYLENNCWDFKEEEPEPEIEVHSENPMCQKHPDSEALPDEDDNCSLCGGDCCDF